MIAYILLTTTDNNGCQKSNTIDITVNPIPSATTVSANPRSGSGATSTQLTANGCSGTVTWSLGNTVGNPITATFNQTTGYTLYCTENACVGPNRIGTFNIPNPCPSNVVLISTPDNYSANFYYNSASQFDGIINATNKINGTARVVYQSKAIVFNPGFSVESNAGAIFTAETGGCTSD